jgi:hypothetical protein
MAAEATIEALLEALELADDSISFYFDVETGQVCSITEEEFDLAEDTQTDGKKLPDWQREQIALARKIQQHEGKRYLALPDKFDIDEWSMMERFTEALEDEQLRNDFRDGIHGRGAFRRFKGLLTEYNLWAAWHRLKDAEFRKIAEEWCKENGITLREARQ